MSADQTVAVQVSKEFKAAPERVFGAWLDPARVKYWFAPGLGEMIRTEIDPRVGGAFRLDQQRGDEVARHWGRYLEIDRSRRLVFTWCVDGVAAEDVVTIDITPTEAGSRLVLTHQMGADFAECIGLTERGWTMMLNGIENNLDVIGASPEPARLLTMSRRFAASPQQVFEAWTQPETVQQWLFTSPESESNQTELDIRVGGQWRIADRRGGQDYTAQGEYLEVDSPRRLVFTFAMPQFSPNSDRITIEFEPDEGGCLMRFTQEGVDIAEEMRQLEPGSEGGSEMGWRQMFDQLGGILVRDSGYGTVLESGAIRFERLLPGPIERVWAYLVESDKRGQWLASGEMPRQVGTEFSMRFQHAGLSPNQVEPPERFRKYEGGVDGKHRVTRFEPYTALAITWGGGGEEPSEVLFELAEAGDKVRLTLTHRRLADTHGMIDVSGGWHTHLAVLADRLNGRTPPAFWALFGDIEDRYGERFKTGG